MKHKDLTGEKFGRLTVIKQHSHPKGGVYYYLCECDCEQHTQLIVEGKRLTTGNTQSCGCLHREMLIKRNKSNRLYEEKDDRLVRIWRAMHHRCESKIDEHYKNYGGKGIKVCEEWKDFEFFNDWAWSNGYNDNLTIDRIDSNGNYEPCNCRWVSQKEQTNNTNRNKYITYQGATKTLAQWCEELGLNYSRTKARLNTLHWSVEDAFERDKYSKNN